jgi:NADP-dependent 3-hydroxy acid dehydrogenase YdfG
MLIPERVAETLLSLAQQPSSNVVEDITLMPAAGVL